MPISHIAIWTIEIEKMNAFYRRYFRMVSNEKYTNEAKGFCSYFLSSEEGPRLELMHRNDIRTDAAGGIERPGLAHVAFSVGSKERVDALTRELKQDGYTVIDGPRQTGDGYYESVVLDPEENRIEITI